MRISRIMLMAMVAVMTSLICLHGEVSQAGDSTVPGDFATIQGAIDDAGTVAGDTINLLAQTYTESNIHINKAVTIAGVGTGSTILDPSSNVNVFYVDADYVTIKDLTIQNASQAVRFEMSGGTINNTEINNVEFLNNSSRGIEIHNDTTVTNLRVLNSTFDNNNIGIRWASSGKGDGVLVDSSTFKNHVSLGIYEANDGSTGYVKDLTVINSHFENNGFAAIYGEELMDVLVDNNTFMDQERGFYLWRAYAGASVQAGNITISNNEFHDHSAASIQIVGENREYPDPATSPSIELPVMITGNTITQNVAVLTVNWARIDIRFFPDTTHGAVTVDDNNVTLSGSFTGGATAALAAKVRGNFDGVTFSKNLFDGDGVGNNGGTPPTSGIYIVSNIDYWGSAPAGATLTATCNTITGFVNGVSIYDESVGAWGGLPSGTFVYINFNNILGNSSFGVRNDGTSEIIDARDNWWGDASGPSGVGPGSGDAVTANVDFDPWLSKLANCEIQQVNIDIKPRHCPNILKKKGKKKGGLKVAILGTQDFDVTTIDVATLNINGVTPVKTKFKDVTSPAFKTEPCDCEKLSKDTYEDLELKLNSQDIIATLGAVQDGDIIELTFTGNLLDGTPIVGKDCVLIKVKDKK
jgi:hypothetical protein